MKQHRKTKSNIPLHHWFLPTKKNHFHPVILRPIGLAFIALVLVFIPLTYNVTATGRPQVLGYATDISASGLNSATNQQRANAGLGALRINSALNQAANNKAADMFAQNYWAHTSPEGKQFFTFIQEAGYSYSIAGENLAKNFSTSDGVVTAWMNSASHRANLLNGSFVDVGYAVMNGNLLGEDVTLVVAEYGAPKAAPAPAPAPAPTQSTTPKTTAPKATAPAPATPTTTPASQTPPATEPTSTAPAPTSETSSPPEHSQGSASKVTQTAQAATTDPSSDAAVEGASIVSLPAKAYQSLNWGQKASLFILTVVLLLFIMKHTLIWRESRRGVRDVWLRAHPLAQGAMLIGAIVLMIGAGTGSIL
jgi:uncharacterized protein YkwD